MGKITMSVPRLRRIAGRWYWRPTPAIKRLGFRAVALGADIKAAIDMAERLNRAVAAELAGKRRGPRPGSIAALLDLYEADERFAALKPNSRRQYLSIMKEIRRNAGDLDVAGITRKDMKATYRALQARGPSVAAAHMRFWRVLLGHAVDEGIRPDNPATRLRVKAAPARSTTWTSAELAAFCACAAAQGRASVALAVRLADETSQRVGDVLRASWRDWDGISLAVEQMKTGARVRVPVSAELRDTLGAVERIAVSIVADERNRAPYGDHAFRQHFNRIRAKAGLAHLRFHDLRRTALTEAGAGGASVMELRALGGHADVASLQRYVVPTSDAAQGAQAKRLPIRTRGGKD